MTEEYYNTLGANRKKWTEYFSPLDKTINSITDISPNAVTEIVVSPAIFDQYKLMCKECEYQFYPDVMYRDIPLRVSNCFNFEYEFLLSVAGSGPVKGLLKPPTVEPQWIRESESEAFKIYRPTTTWRATITENVWIDFPINKPPNLWYRFWQRLLFGFKWTKVGD